MERQMRRSISLSFRHYQVCKTGLRWEKKNTFKVLLEFPVKVHVLYMKVKKMNINKTVAAEV